VFLLQSPFSLQMQSGNPTGYALPVVTLLCALILFANLSRSLALFAACAFPTLFFAYALLSWLVSNVGPGAGDTPLRFIMTAVVASGLAVRQPPERVARIVFAAIAMSVVLSLVWALVFPAYGVHQFTDPEEPFHAGDWRGIYVHKNRLGPVAAISLVLLLLDGRALLPNRLARWLVGLVSAACLVMSHSATALVMAAALPAVHFVLTRYKGGLRVALLVGGAIVCWVAYEYLAPWLVEDVLGRSLTFTGRTRIWQTAFALIGANWLLGLGMGTTMGGNFEQFLSHALWPLKLTVAHSSYIEMVANVGVVGLSLWMIGLLVSLRNSVRMISDPRTHAAGSVFVVILTWWLLNGYVESDPARPGNLPLVLACIALFSACSTHLHRATGSLSARGAPAAVAARQGGRARLGL
jgi:O-antigen ligase